MPTDNVAEGDDAPVEFELARDCKHVHWDRPCAPHKKRGKVCGSCDEYSKVEHRVLIVKLAATGDVLRTTSFLPAVHATWSGARVTWVTKKGAAALFAGNDLVDQLRFMADEAITRGARVEAILTELRDGGELEPAKAAKASAKDPDAAP